MTQSKTVKRQTKTTEWREYKDEYGNRCRLKAKIRYDDECSNGHNTFAITATGEEHSGGRWRDSIGGCCHDEIAKVFPEYKKYIKWHLMSADAPMHYIANATYHASNRDYNGLLKGEPNHKHDKTGVYFEGFPIEQNGFRSAAGFVLFLQGLESFDLEVIGIDHDDRETYGTKYTFGGYGSTWYDCPFDTEKEALEFLEAMNTRKMIFKKVVTSWGKGKERDFDAARSCAIWPEATDEQLSLPRDELTALLEARRPALVAEFRADMEELGFTY